MSLRAESFGGIIHVSDARAYGLARLLRPEDDHCQQPSFERRLKMPTTIEFPLSANISNRFNPSSIDRVEARIGFAILMLWALIMLSIGAAAHFGAQSSDYNAFELLALF
jgi:hypothetical protein